MTSTPDTGPETASTVRRTGGLHFPFMEGTRGLATLVVITAHWLVAVGEFDNSAGWLLLQIGYAGVAFFFVLSGFLLYGPFVRARLSGRPLPSVRNFYRRRAARILPGYWLALTLLAIWPGLTGVFSGDWWRYYGFAMTYSREGINGGLGPAWTLCVEVVFYLALPVVAVALHRWGGRRIRLDLVAFATIALASFGFRAWAATTGEAYMMQNIGACAAFFAIGMTLAALHARADQIPVLDAFRRRLAVRIEVFWGLAAASLGVTAVLTNLDEPLSFGAPTGSVGWSIYYLGVCVTAFLLVLPAALPGVPSRRGLGRVLNSRSLIWLGTISFGLYLWHQPLEVFVGPSSKLEALPGPTGEILGFGAVLLATLACAVASWYLVERPIMRRFWHARAARRTVLDPGDGGGLVDGVAPRAVAPLPVASGGRTGA